MIQKTVVKTIQKLVEVSVYKSVDSDGDVTGKLLGLNKLFNVLDFGQALPGR